MAEPENLVLEHLRAVRGSIEQLERGVGRLDARIDSRFERVEERLDDHERRIARIEAERA